MESSVNKALRLLEASIGNISQHVYDDFVERNVKSAFNSGMKAVIIRRQMFKCCDFCAKLSGIYDYAQGDYPDDIFKRHANCRCLVSVKTEKTGSYQDVWSKKEYRTQKKARQAREKEILAEDKNYQKYLRKKEVAKAEGKRFFDATEYYSNKPKEYPADVIDTPKKFTYKGTEYEQDGVHVFIDEDIDAENMRQLLKAEYGGKIERFPQIQQIDKDHPAQQTPDFLWNGIPYDVKRLDKGNNNPECIYNAIAPKKKQASRFVIDVSDSALNIEKIYYETGRMFLRKSWTEQIILVKNNKIIKIFERV